MLNFKPITLESRRDLLPFLGKKHHSACYQSFATMYLWSGIYKTRYCLTGEWLFTKSGREDGYGFPYGDGDLKEGITLLRQDAKENGKELWFFGLLPTEKAWLEANYPGEFTYTASRDDAEYIYEADKLMTYAGKKLHAKRNHIHQFMAQYGERYEYVKITGDMMGECVDVYNEWLSEKSPDETDNMELCAIKTLLMHMDVLGIRGGGIRIDGKLAAFTLGQKMDDNMAVVHIEKADNEIMGLYTVINNQFVQHELTDVKFINREEDMGMEGLRKAKLSYYPAYMIDKFDGRPI